MINYKKLKKGIIEIKCDFCKQLLVRDYDLSQIDEDEFDNLPDPIWEIECPHVAAQCVWGYVDTEVSKLWINEINEFNEFFDNEKGVSGIEEFFSSRIFDSGGNGIQENIKISSKLKIKFINLYAEKFNGVKEGGPTFLIILMNKYKT